MTDGKAAVVFPGPHVCHVLTSYMTWDFKSQNLQCSGRTYPIYDPTFY